MRQFSSAIISFFYLHPWYNKVMKTRMHGGTSLDNQIFPASWVTEFSWYGATLARFTLCDSSINFQFTPPWRSVSPSVFASCNISRLDSKFFLAVKNNFKWRNPLAFPPKYHTLLHVDFRSRLDEKTTFISNSEGMRF